MISDDHPETFREVGLMFREIRNDVADAHAAIREIKSGQQKVIWWVASALSSFVIGGILGWVFQR